MYRWNADTGTETLLIEQREQERTLNFTDIRLNHQGTFAATYSISGTISIEDSLTIYDLTAQPVVSIYEQMFPPTDAWDSIAISPDGSQVATGGNNANVRIRTTADGETQFRDDRPPNEFSERTVVDLAYSPDGRYIAGCVNTVGTGFAFVRDAQTGEELTTISGIPGIGLAFFDSVAFNPTGDLIAFGGGDGTIRIWRVDLLLQNRDATAEDAPIILQAHTMPVVDVNFSHNGTQIASAGWDGIVTLWNYDSQRRLKVFSVDEDRAWSAMLSPTGDELATSSENGKVILWDVNGETSRVLDELIPANQYDDPTILALAFSLDGSVLAGSSHNGAIFLWDVASGARRTLIEKNGNPVWHLEFSLDGKLLAAANLNSTVHLWGVPSGA